MTEPSKSEQARIYHQLSHEYEHQDNLNISTLTAKLIEAGKDDFDVHLAFTFHSLVNQLSKRRNIPTRIALRRIAECSSGEQGIMDTPMGDGQYVEKC